MIFSRQDVYVRGGSIRTYEQTIVDVKVKNDNSILVGIENTVPVNVENYSIPVNVENTVPVEVNNGYLNPVPVTAQ